MLKTIDNCGRLVVLWWMFITKARILRVIFQNTCLPKPWRRQVRPDSENFFKGEQVHPVYSSVVRITGQAPGVAPHQVRDKLQTRRAEADRPVCVQRTGRL